MSDVLTPEYPDTRARHAFPYDHGNELAAAQPRKYTGRHRAAHDDRCEQWAAGRCGCHLRARGVELIHGGASR